MKTEEQLDELISALSKERSPQRDLWPGLEQALQNTPQLRPENSAPQTDKVVPLRTPQPARVSWARGAFAGAIAASLLMTAILLPQLHNASGPVAPAAVVASAADPEDAGNSWLTQAVASRVQVLDDMLPRLSHMEFVPEGFGNWQQQLGIWMSASEQLEDALRQQPNNRQLQRQYQTLQRQNAQYLQRLLMLSQA